VAVLVAQLLQKLSENDKVQNFANMEIGKISEMKLRFSEDMNIG